MTDSPSPSQETPSGPSQLAESKIQNEPLGKSTKSPLQWVTNALKSYNGVQIKQESKSLFSATIPVSSYETIQVHISMHGYIQLASKEQLRIPFKTKDQFRSAVVRLMASVSTMDALNRLNRATDTKVVQDVPGIGQEFGYKDIKVEPKIVEF